VVVGDNQVGLVVRVVGAGVDASRVDRRHDTDVEIERLAREVNVYGAADVLAGGDGDDCVTGDNDVRLGVEIAGAIPGTVNVEIEGLAGDLEVRGGDDRIDGGAGDDRLLGDNDVVVAGLTIDTDVAGGMCNLEIEGLVCGLTVAGGRDVVAGGNGDDRIAGDNALSLTGVQLEGGGAARRGAPSANTPLPEVEIQGLIGHVDVCSGDDVLDGGDGNDDVHGDNLVSIAGVTGAAGTGTALRVEVECGLIDCMDVGAGDDRITGGAGDDTVTGDNRVEIAGVVGVAAAGARLDVEVDELVRHLWVGAGADQLGGGLGNDRVIGDQQLLLAGVVLDGAIGGSLGVDVDGLVDALTLEACGDVIDGGDANDILVGDHVIAAGAVLDRSAHAAFAGAASGQVAVDIDALVRCLDAKGANDQITGGAGTDLLIGDTQTVVAAYLGSFASPVAAGIRICGDELIVDLDVDAGRDTLRGGDGDDTLVGDSDTTVIASAAGKTPAGSNAMGDLIERLSVSSATDTLGGDAGKNLLEQGNRATVGKGLVDRSSISSLSKTSAPAPAPVIDWQGGLCNASAATDGTPAGWLASFVVDLGRTAEELNPNAKIRIKF
jgi:Ca2+-binding RTX toxin-like protein